MRNSTGKLKQAVVLGAINNLLFSFGGGALSFLQFVIVMRVVGPEEVGLFAIAAALALMFESLSDFGIAERLVQVSRDRLEHAFRLAVIVHFLLALGLWLLILAAAPLAATFYEEPRLRILIVAMSYGAFTGLLRLPLALLYRELRYFQHRLLMFLGRLSGFLVTVVLVYVGAGIWSLVAGGVTALFVTSALAWYLSPIKPGWPVDRQGLGELFSFSWPLYFSRIAMVLVQQGAILVLSTFLSPRDVGQYKAAEQFAFFLVSFDVIIGQTLFPALCKVKESNAQLGEAFTKASRVSMFWTAGGGVAMMVFANALIHYVLTNEWSGGEIFMRAHGLALLLGGIGYSWGSLFMAKGRTMPILNFTLAFGAAFAVFFVPLTYIGGRLGAAVGLGATSLVGLVAKQFILDRFHFSISLFKIAWRAAAAALAASVAALALRGALESDEHLTVLLVLLVAYSFVFITVFLWAERKLIWEVMQEFDVGRRLSGLLSPRHPSWDPSADRPDKKAPRAKLEVE